MITIYHNSRCSKSRGAFCLLEDKSAGFTVRNYMEQVLSKDELLHLQQKLKLPLLEMVRTNEAVYKTRFGKHQPSDEELLQAILEHPILLQRPIVETETAAIIARPPEKVLDFIS